MKNLFTLLVLSVCILSAMAADQKQPEPIDTLLERFDNKPGLKTAREFFAYMDKEEFMDEPVVFTDLTPLDTMKALVWYWAGEWYYAEQEYTLAEKNLLRALELMEYADEKSISDNLAMLGLTFMRQSKYDEALHYMRRCYQLDSKSGDPDRISSSLNTIAGTLLAAGNPEEAEGYILRAITYAKRANTPPSRTAVIFGMASEIENRLEHKEQALLYADSACMVEATTGNNYKMAVRQTQKASILVSMERYEEAEKILAEVVPYFREAGDQLSLAIALNKRGQAARYLGHLDDAVEYLSESIEICQRIGNPYNEAYAQRAIYEILYKSNPDAARMHLERYHLLKDSLYSHATAEQLARFNAEFGRDELEKEKEQLTRRNHRLVAIGIAAGVGAIVIIIVCLIWFRKRQSRTDELLSNMMTELSEARRSSASEQEQENAETEPEQPEQYLTREDKQFLKKLILYVTQAMEYQTVTVTQIADKMCMSPKTLNRRLQYLTGEGAKRYIMRIQLEQAKIMLLQNLDIPIVEIGNRCGFEDHSSFTRTFTQNVGMSPSDYRLTRGQG